MKQLDKFKEQIFKVQSSYSQSIALKVFKFQLETNEIYRSYLTHLKITPENISSLTEIPFLPITFFKTSEILLNNLLYETVFKSSGTGGIKSQHFIHDISWYHKVAQKIFSDIYGNLENMVIIALLPSYQENQSSSLISMVNFFMSITRSSLSGFVKSPEEIKNKVFQGRKEHKKIILFGVTYALLDLARFKIDLRGVTIIETGGMKGRKKEITRAELHQTLKKNLQAEIHSEYGMTELQSQAYTKKESIFSPPSWMKVFTREINDPFADNTGKRIGILKVMDLANLHSMAFIETEDLGFVYPNGDFEVLGRMDQSEIRGCSLLYRSTEQ